MGDEQRNLTSQRRSASASLRADNAGASARKRDRMGDRMTTPSSAGKADPSKVSEAAESALLLALTTEHFTLQTARASTIAESNGRVSLFLGAVSSCVVAIALVGQLSGFGERFFV